MRNIYERLWDRYEEIHGVDHPVRWYQHQGATTPARAVAVPATTELSPVDPG
jgi:hypothetical protein